MQGQSLDEYEPVLPGVVYHRYWEHYEWVKPEWGRELADPIARMSALVLLGFAIFWMNQRKQDEPKWTRTSLFMVGLAGLALAFSLILGDDGDGDIAGLQVAWSIPAYSLLACLIITRPRINAWYWWPLELALLAYSVCRAWMYPFFFSMWEALWVLPWILLLVTLRVLVRVRGQPQGEALEDWMRVTSFTVYLMAGSAFVMLVGGASDEGLLYRSVFYTLFLSLLIPVAILLLALRQLFFPEREAFVRRRRAMRSYLTP